MADYQTIITAAGDSRPLFLPAGFKSPKSLVHRDGRTVIEQAVQSYADSLARTVVAVNRDEAETWPIEATLTSAFPAIRVVAVPSSAKGALISALMASADLAQNLPLVVAAGDSYIRGGIRSQINELHASGCAAGTIVFRSQDPRWSYLATDAAGSVTQVAEKQVIGSLATTGVFYFRQGKDFLESAQWCLVNSAHRSGLYYVSATLNHLLVTGRNVEFVEIPGTDYVPNALPIDFVGD